MNLRVATRTQGEATNKFLSDIKFRKGHFAIAQTICQEKSMRLGFIGLLGVFNGPHF